MANHTPGPWEMVNGFMHAPAIHAAGVKVATPNWLGATVGTLQGSGKATEILANAHLIAAAPELLEALEQIALTMRGARNLYRDDSVFVANLRQAESAIQKARGV